MNGHDILIFDISNIFYRSYAAFDLNNESGTDVSGIFGTLNTIQSLIKSHGPKCVVGVFDGRGGADRKRKRLGTYKEKRSIPIKLNFFVNSQLMTPHELEKYKNDARDNFLWQLQKLNEFLAVMPVKRVVVEGYEADDIIAYVAKKYFSPYSKLIVSQDKDYHQLVDDTTSIWNFNDLITKEKLREIWGTDSGDAITMVRTIEGDKSDNINGLYGFGLKTIQKYLPFLFAGYQDRTVDGFLVQLSEHIETIRSQKKAYGSNWKTLLAKAEHIRSGMDKSGESCTDILKRNHWMMQLNDPQLRTDAKMVVSDFLTHDVRFEPTVYKMMTISEGLRMKGVSLMGWEMQFRDLQHNMNKFNTENIGE